MKRNGGFSLVELMVAMVIGLVIILGAGQLFLTVFQTSHQVGMLSEKQAAVNFSVEMLLRDIRRAHNNSIGWDDGVLSLTVSNRGDLSESVCAAGIDVEKKYFLSEKNLQLSQGCGTLNSPDSIVSAFDPDGPNEGFSVASGDGDGVWIVSLDFLSTDGDGATDSMSFYAVNRTEAVNAESSE